MLWDFAQILNLSVLTFTQGEGQADCELCIVKATLYLFVGHSYSLAQTAAVMNLG